MTSFFSYVFGQLALLNILKLEMQINDRYEFPLQLDLDRDNGKYLSPDADRSVRNLYMLHRYMVPFKIFVPVITKNQTTV